jgi:hypothetical protein
VLEEVHGHPQRPSWYPWHYSDTDGVLAIMRSPDYVQLSTAAATTLGIMKGAMHRIDCTRCLNLLLTYPEGCRADCDAPTRVIADLEAALRGAELADAEAIVDEFWSRTSAEFLNLVRDVIVAATRQLRFVAARHPLRGRRIAAARTARPPLVLLHDALGCVRLWRDIPERLAAQASPGRLVAAWTADRPPHSGIVPLVREGRCPVCFASREPRTNSSPMRKSMRSVPSSPRRSTSATCRAAAAPHQQGRRRRRQRCRWLHCSVDRGHAPAERLPVDGVLGTAPKHGRRALHGLQQQVGRPRALRSGRREGFLPRDSASAASRDGQDARSNSHGNRGSP